MEGHTVGSEVQRHAHWGQKRCLLSVTNGGHLQSVLITAMNHLMKTDCYSDLLDCMAAAEAKEDSLVRAQNPVRPASVSYSDFGVCTTSTTTSFALLGKNREKMPPLDICSWDFFLSTRFWGTIEPSLPTVRNISWKSCDDRTG